LKDVTIPDINAPLLKTTVGIAPLAGKESVQGHDMASPDGKFHKDVQQTKTLNIHNDIDGAAHFLSERVAKRAAENDRDGLTFDGMAAGTMIAFAHEAYLNFFGAKLVTDWDGWVDFDTKVAQVHEVLKLKPDLGVRPYSTLNEMKTLRDTLAHGTPKTVEVEKEVIDTADGRAGKKLTLSADWEKLCTPEMIARANEDLEKVFKEMLKASGLNALDTTTSGEGAVIQKAKFDPFSKFRNRKPPNPQ
jgi:hypothetical protein